MSTPKKRLRHRAYMQGYRQRPEYRRSDRAYNLVEYLVHCLRAVLGHEKVMSTPESRKRLRHRVYMQVYRQRPEYRRSDRAYNVVEYFVRCLRACWKGGGEA